jgi:hypothetical protein
VLLLDFIAQNLFAQTKIKTKSINNFKLYQNENHLSPRNRKLHR